MSLWCPGEGDCKQPAGQAALLTGETIDQLQVRYEKLVRGLEFPSFLFFLFRPSPTICLPRCLAPRVFLSQIDRDSRGTIPRSPPIFSEYSPTCALTRTHTHENTFAVSLIGPLQGTWIPSHTVDRLCTNTSERQLSGTCAFVMNQLIWFHSVALFCFQPTVPRNWKL